MSDTDLKLILVIGISLFFQTQLHDFDNPLSRRVRQIIKKICVMRNRHMKVTHNIERHINYLILKLCLFEFLIIILHEAVHVIQLRYTTML